MINEVHVGALCGLSRIFSLLVLRGCYYHLAQEMIITKSETRDDNNNRVTPTVKCEKKPHKIKHCEINGQRANRNTVFAS